MADVYSCHAILTAPLPTQPVVVYAFIHNVADTGLAKVKCETCASSHLVSPAVSPFRLPSLVRQSFLFGTTLCYHRDSFGRADVSISMSAELDKLVPLRETTSRFLLACLTAARCQ